MVNNKMSNWKNISVSEKNTLLEVMQIIDKGTKQIALVVDDNNHLIGTVTDGDIRRALLKGFKLDSLITSCINTNPMTGLEGENPNIWQRLMQKNSLRILPILTSQGCVTQISQLEFPLESVKENQIIIMAGGLGSRLHPLTLKNPKPLLEIGNRPILETIIKNFTEQGFYKFSLSINYQGHKIKDFFRNGEKFNSQINYLEEKQRLGTAGALSLLKEKPQYPFIVMNGDILTKVDFNRLLEFHQQKNNALTLCTREYTHQIPYGVIEQKEHKITNIKEKPQHYYQINAGIYILNPEILTFIDENEYLDMPQLIELLLNKNYQIGSFPLTDYWLDIGRMEDFERAHEEFFDIFEYKILYILIIPVFYRRIMPQYYKIMRILCV